MNKTDFFTHLKISEIREQILQKAFNVSGNLLPDGYTAIEIVTIFMLMNNKNKFEVQITNSLL